MRRLLLTTIFSTILLCSVCNPTYSITPNQEVPVQFVQHQEESEIVTTPEIQHEEDHSEDQAGEHGEAHEGDHGEEHEAAPPWTVIPFVLLLLMIATGPLFYEHFWHKNYPILAVLLAVMVVSYYLFALGNAGEPVHALFEYLQFIALLSSLFIASGGILIKIDRKATPIINSAILLIGSVISNLIGTTGASMLLIRPYIRLNQHRIRSYHIIFFIFMV